MPADRIRECAEELLYAIEAQARAQRLWEVAEANYSNPRLEHRKYVDAVMRVGEAVEELREALADDAPGEMVPNNDKVICPNCCHQFRAVPVNVQRLMLDAGLEPPFMLAAKDAK